MATTPATSSIPNGSSSVRLLSDPNSVVCPDFSAEAYKELRKDLGPDDAGAIAKLTAGWVKDNDQLKVQWAAQEDADKAVQEAEDVQRQLEAEKAAAEAEKLAEEERLEAEKKKPKLGDFDVNKLIGGTFDSPKDTETSGRHRDAPPQFFPMIESTRRSSSRCIPVEVRSVAKLSNFNTRRRFNLVNCGVTLSEA
ncbi:hypothetical protein B0H11DRAFT_2200742 [Mycena galericulata]|nr:hypothetical protein B0H11DRAFT_2200742 [Mycena galericulata]